jgi:hypothetical protein
MLVESPWFDAGLGVQNGLSTGDRNFDRHCSP